MNLIYSIKNKINGKEYIGRTMQSVSVRWNQHKSRCRLGERDHKLYQAMREYGIENFTHTPICCVLEDKDLQSVESFFINKKDTTNKGYNMVSTDHVLSKESKKKISDKLKGRKITWYDKILDSKKKNNSFNSGKLFGKDHPKHSSYCVGCPNGVVKKFHGLRAFCRIYDLDHKALLDTLKGKQTHHKGFTLLSKFNDYSDRKYAQASGNGAHPLKQDGDIVWSAQKRVAA